MRSKSALAAAILLFAISGHAIATPVTTTTTYNVDVPNVGWQNGTGPVDGHFAVDQENGVTLALRASLRFIGPITPTSNNIYSAPQSAPGATTALWNFDYSYDPGTNVGTTTTIDITDNHGDLLPFAIPLDGFDNKIVGTASQNSENIGFFPFSFLGGFDPTVAAIYNIDLTTTDTDGQTLGSVDIQVNVGAVPEPSTWAMMLLGFLGVGFMAYRNKNTLRFA